MLHGLAIDLLRTATAGASFAWLAPACPRCPDTTCGSLSCPEVHCGACALHPSAACASEVDGTDLLSRAGAVLAVIIFVLGLAVGALLGSSRRSSSSPDRRRGLGGGVWVSAVALSDGGSRRSG